MRKQQLHKNNLHIHAIPTINAPRPLPFGVYGGLAYYLRSMPPSLFNGVLSTLFSLPTYCSPQHLTRVVTTLTCIAYRLTLRSMMPMQYVTVLYRVRII